MMVLAPADERCHCGNVAVGMVERHHVGNVMFAIPAWRCRHCGIVGCGCGGGYADGPATQRWLTAAAVARAA